MIYSFELILSFLSYNKLFDPVFSCMIRLICTCPAWSVLVLLDLHDLLDLSCLNCFYIRSPSMDFPGTDDLCGDYFHGLDIVSSSIFIPGNLLFFFSFYKSIIYYKKYYHCFDILICRSQSRNRVFVELSNGIDVNKNQILKFRPSFIPAI